MASVWRHPNSKFWTACYTLPNGRRMKRSTKLQDRKKALHIACVLENEAGKGLTEQKARALVSALLDQLGAGNLRDETVLEYFERWLQRKQAEVSDGTLRKYRETASHFFDYIGDGGRKRTLASITQREIAAFRDQLARKLGTSTVNCALKILKGAFSEAVISRVISVNEAAGVKGLVKSRALQTRKRRPFTIAEINQLLAIASEEWRGMIFAGLYICGPRLGDVARWTKPQVDMVAGEIRFRTRKTGRWQVVPIAAPLLAVLRPLIEKGSPTGPVFPEAAATIGRSKNGSVGTLSNQFHSILVVAGLAEPRSHLSMGKGRSAQRNQSELSFHSLRHTATSLLKTAGVGGAIVQDLVGHDSAAMSEHYTHIDTEAKRVAVGKLPALAA